MSPGNRADLTAAGGSSPPRAGRRRLRITLVGIGVVVMVAAMAGGLSRLRLDTTVSSVSAQDGSVRTWTQEQQSFGGDPIAVLLTSKQPAQLLSGQPVYDLLALEGRLSKLANVSVVYGPATTLNEIVISVKHLVSEITDQSQTVASQAETHAAAAGASPAAQQAAGQAAQQAFDVRYGSLLTQGLKLGLPSLSNASYGPTVFLPGGKARSAFHWLVPDATHVAILIRPSPNLSQSGTGSLVRQVQAAVKGAGLPLASSEVTGQPVIAAALGSEVVNELPLLAPIVVVVVAACFFVTRRRVRWWERLLPLAVGLVATGATMAIFGWFGVPLSIGLLAFLPIILGVGTDYPIYALRNGRPRQILAAAVASGASLALLASSPLPFVRDLGLALVVGLVLSALLGLAVARVLGLGGGRPPRTPGPPDEESDITEQHRPGPPRWLRSVARTAARHRRAPLAPRRARRRWLVGGAVGLAVGVAGWSFLTSLPLNSDPQSLAAGLPALRQGVKAQSILGASGELDVYVRGPGVLTPAYLSWYDKSQATLVAHHATELDPIVSPASLLSWLGPNPSTPEIDSALQLLPSYLTTVTVRDDQAQAVMAFGVKLGSLENESRLIASVKSELPPLPPGATVSITGLPAVAAHSNGLLSGDRIVPNVAGIGAFGLVLALTLRRRRDALLAVLSAALATGWGLAVLRATGTPLTPLTVSLGSLTSAIGGEFAVMALSRYATAQRRPWSAVAVAATTSVVGFAVLAFSRLNLLRQFGLVLAVSVLLALLAAWVVVSVSRVDWRPGQSTPPGPVTPGPLRSKASTAAERVVGPSDPQAMSSLCQGARR